MIKLGKTVLCFVLCCSVISWQPIKAQAAEQAPVVETVTQRDRAALNYTPKDGEDLTAFHEAPLYDAASNQLLLPRVAGYTTTIYGSDRKATISLDGTVERGLSTQTVSLLYTFTNKETKEEIHTTKEAQVVIPGRELSFSGANKMPKVLPQLREWAGGDGMVSITTSSRIVYQDDALANTAIRFQEDLKDLTGRTLTIVKNTKASVMSGDIFLDLDDTAVMLGKEGYYLEIGGEHADQDYVIVRSSALTGVYYGTISIMQILKQDETRTQLPKGISRDYPQFEERGLMMDVARKYFTMDYLENITKQMSWYKLNLFSLHLSDNDIWNSLSLADGDENPEGWFRLECETFPKLTSEQHYTKEEFRNLQQLGLDLGVEVVPELDTPGHALAYTQAWEGTARPDNPKYLDVTNPQVLENVKAMYDEYIFGYQGGEPTFIGDKVNIGTDEYKTGGASNPAGYREGFRAYTDALLNHINASGKEAVFWGSLTENWGETPVTTDAIMFAWFQGYANAKNSLDAGYKIISMEDSEVYVVPGGGYYHNQFGRGEYLYNSWMPHDNYGWAGNPAVKSHPNVLGGQMGEWNDFVGNGISMQDVNYRIEENLHAIAEKTWAGTERKDAGTSYKDFNAFAKALGDAPNTEFLYDIENKIEILDNEVLKIKDGSKENELSNQTGATVIESKNVTTNADSKDGAGLTFAGNDSYLRTNVKSTGFDWTAAFWMKPADNLGEETVLMEGNTGQLVLLHNKLAYKVEQYTHTFDTAIDPSAWTHVALKGDEKGVSLYLNGDLIDTLADKPYPDYNCNSGNNSWNGTYPNNGTCRTTRYYETLMLPMETIGSAANAFKGELDDLLIYNRMLSDNEIALLAGTEKVTYKNLALHKPVTASGNEGASTPAEKVVDGDESTRWASNYSDEAWLTIDLQKEYNVDHVKILWEASYGKQYKIQVSTDGATWQDVFTETNGSQGWKDIKFEQKSNVRYVKFQGLERPVVAGGKWGYSMFEFEVYGDVLEGAVDIDPDKTYKNVALNKQAVSTHHHNDTVEGQDRIANNAVDGSLSSRFEFDVNEAGENNFTLTLNDDEDVNHMSIKEMVWGANAPSRISSIRVTAEKNGVETELLAEQEYGAWDTIEDFNGNQKIAAKKWIFNKNSDMGATIHVYLTPKASGADDLVNIAELELYGSVEEIVADDTIPHKQMTAFASSENAFAAGIEGPAYLAIDDNTGTWWHTNYSPVEPLPQSLTLDLNEIMTVGKYRYLPRPQAANGTVTKYEIHVSIDNASYQKVAEGTWAETAAEKTVEFTPVRARYVRLLVLEGKGGYGTASEVNVHTAQRSGIDKSYLQNKITEGQTLIDHADGDLTTSSIALLQEALHEALSVLADDAAEQEAVDAAMSDLQETMESIVRYSDIETLQEFYEEQQTFFDGLNKADVTSDSYQALKTQLEITADSLQNQETLTKSEMISIKNDLVNAKENLIDRSELNSIITEVEAVFNSDLKAFYTNASLDALQEPLRHAKDMYETGSTLYEMKSAAYDLMDVMDALAVNYDVLQKEIDIYKDAEDYTVGTWTIFVNVLDEAQAAINDHVTAEVLKTHYDALTKAAIELKKRGNIVPLQELLEEYKTLDETAYTAASWNAYAEIKTQAENMIQDASDVDEVMVQAMIHSLKDAKEALVEKPVEQVDRTALQKKVDTYQEVNYTTSSWSKFTVYQEAVQALTSDTVTQEQIDQLVIRLETESFVLVKRGNITPLQELLDEYSSLNAYDYTLESWDMYAKLEEQAKAMVQDASDADETMVQTMITSLQAAMQALVQRPVISVDKTALQEQVDAYQESDYTTSSWAAFTVYHQAILALSSEYVTQEEVDALTAGFPEGANVLVKRGNIAPLQELLETYQELEEASYTADSWYAYAEIKARAENMIQNLDDVDEVMVQEMITSLKDAKEALVEKPVEQVDKTALKEKIDAYQETDYTMSSWSKFVVYQEAVQALASDAITQEQINRLINRLDTESSVLVRRGNVSELETLMQQMDTLDQALYTEQSWQKVEIAIAEANKLIQNYEDVTQDQVTKACKQLQAAHHALVKKQMILKHPDTNVRLEAEQGILPENTTMSVNKFTQKDSLYEQYQTVIAALGNQTNFTAFDILLICDGASIQPNGNVRILLDVPAGYDTNHMKLYYIDEHGVKQEIAFIVIDASTIAFETNHFSIYALVDTQKLTPPMVNPINPLEPNKPVIMPVQTGDEADNGIWISMLMVSGFVIVIQNRRKRIKIHKQSI